MNSLLYIMSKPPPVNWNGVNTKMYQANLRKRVGRMETDEVVGFTYINNVGRVQYAYAPVVVWSIGGKEVEKIVANSCARINELAHIEINFDALHSVVNVMKRDQVHPKAKKGENLMDPILARTQWHGEKDMVIYSMPPLLLLPFGFQQIYGSVSDPKVKADFEALGADQAFWVNTMDQAFVNKAKIDELWDNLQGQEVRYVCKDVRIMESTP